MSVLLTATRNAVRKKSAKKPQSAKGGRRTTKPSGSQSGPGVSVQNIKMWQWELDGKPMTLTFRKDTVEIWLNDAKATVMDSFAEESDGAVLDFTCDSHKGTITTCRNEIGELEQVLEIDLGGDNGKVIIE